MAARTRSFMRRLAIVGSAALFASTLVVSPASAQDSNFALLDGAAPARFAGWTLTPALVYQGSWDDNALVLFQPDPPSDFLSLVKPRADLNYLGRLSEFDVSYDGAFLLYR